jgi:hypothetical protein
MDSVSSMLRANKPSMGSDIALTIGILVAWSGITAYVMGKIHMQSYRNNWDEVKCDPHVIPFAGEIMQPIHLGDPDVFTQENLNACAQEVSKKVTDEATGKINEGVEKAFDAMKDAVDMVNDTKNNVTDLGTAMVKMLNEAVQWTNNLRTEINRVVYMVRDTFGKITAIITTVFFSLITFYQTSKSVLGSFIGDIVIVMQALISVIIVALAIPFGFGVGVAVATGISLAAVNILVMALASVMVRTLGLNTPKIPSFCFSPQTMVSVNGGIEKEIQHVGLGDALDGTGAIVRGTLRLKNTDHLGNQREDMYVFDNGAVVSGPHLIFDTKVDRFVSVRDYAATHESAKRSSDVFPELVCLITSNHTIPIGKYTFHDWEDAGVDSMVCG